MKPHLVKWAETYGAKGFLLVDVDNGGIDGKEAVASAVKDLPYRVIWDRESRITNQYGVKGFPAAYLVSAEGKVVWEGFPLPNVAAIETKIQEELEKVAEEKRNDPKPPKEPEEK